MKFDEAVAALIEHLRVERLKLRQKQERNEFEMDELVSLAAGWTVAYEIDEAAVRFWSAVAVLGHTWDWLRERLQKPDAQSALRAVQTL
jgi:hypothetical protein